MTRIHYVAPKDRAGFDCALIVVYDDRGQVVEALSPSESARYTRHSYETLLDGGHISRARYDALSLRGTQLLYNQLHPTEATA